jgi:hypothetical protein
MTSGRAPSTHLTADSFAVCAVRRISVYNEMLDVEVGLRSRIGVVPKTLQVVDIGASNEQRSRILLPQAAEPEWLLIVVEKPRDTVENVCRALDTYVDEPRSVRIVKSVKAGDIVRLLLNQEAMDVVKNLTNAVAQVVNELVVFVVSRQGVARLVLERGLDLFIFCFSQTGIIVDAFRVHGVRI